MITSNGRTFIDQIYDPKYFETNYRLSGNVLYRIDLSTGITYPVRRYLYEKFDNATKLKDLINPSRGWTDITLQSPMAKTVAEYVPLGQCIINETCTFRDNRIDIMPGVAKFYAVAPTSDMVTSKSRLGSELMHFVPGDEVWITMNYYRDGFPISILELESTWVKEWPGIRLLLNDDESLCVEMKWLNKPKFYQSGSIVKLPNRKRVNIKCYFKLACDPSGIIKVWQNGILIINATAQNFPFPDTIYNTIGIGIPANRHQYNTAASVYRFSIKTNTPAAYSL